MEAETLRMRQQLFSSHEAKDVAAGLLVQVQAEAVVRPLLIQTRRDAPPPGVVRSRCCEPVAVQFVRLLQVTASRLRSPFQMAAFVHLVVHFKPAFPGRVVHKLPDAHRPHRRHHARIEITLHHGQILEVIWYTLLVQYWLNEGK